MNENKLTSQKYWENYYSKTYTKESIVKQASQFDRYWNILTEGDCRTIIEIGGYPARYLSYLSNKYALIPTCLDYNSDSDRVHHSMHEMGVENYSILNEDFTKFRTQQMYDIVLSIGFIEHFKNYEEILDKHIEYLNPKGKVLIMIPNKRYLRRIYGFLCDYKNLKAHNLKTMSFNVFKEFSKRNNLQIESLEYYGGFPYRVHQKLNFLQKLIYHPFRFIFKKLNPIIEKKPNKYLSGTIVCICKKK